MNIELATAAHAEILTQLDHSQTFSAHWSLQGWQDELALASSKVWGAWRNGQMVGFIALRGAADQYEISNLAVELGQERQGIGYGLLCHALDDLRSQGGGQISLEVSTANLPAQALYQKAGFTILGHRAHFYPDGSDALIMGRAL